MEQQPHPYGPSVAQLIDEFAKMPGIGRKSAERLAQYVVGMNKKSAAALIQAIDSVKRNLRRCQVCHTLSEQDVCEICGDPRRDRKIVCVVEHPRDAISLEASGAFPGTYHILHGCLSPLNGIGPDQLTIKSLLDRIETDGVQELIMATNPTLEGDGTALYLSNLLEGKNVSITRLARGIATGSVLEFANKEMLADALKGRQTF